MTFFDITRIAGSKHGSKIKKCHIRFVMVIQFKFQIGKLIIRTIITSILDVIQESGFVDIFGVQQSNWIFQILSKLVNIVCGQDQVNIIHNPAKINFFLANFLVIGAKKIFLRKKRSLNLSFEKTGRLFHFSSQKYRIIGLTPDYLGQDILYFLTFCIFLGHKGLENVLCFKK